MKQDMKTQFSIENFDDFTYAKRSHWELFEGLDMELYGEKADPDADVLKRYQDLLILLFIRTFVPQGSRILEVGGGLSRILSHLKDDYECWNADKFEGVGNGPLAPETEDYRLVLDYVGNFNPELPDNYFDFVFSISALEHVPRDDRQFHKNVIDDINRVLKPGGYSLHALDFVINGEVSRQNPFIEFSYDYSKSLNAYVPAKEASLDPDFYFMSQKGYDKHWKWITKLDYGKFGMPSNYTVLWQKPEEGVDEFVEDSVEVAQEPVKASKALFDSTAASMKDIEIKEEDPTEAKVEAPSVKTDSCDALRENADSNDPFFTVLRDSYGTTDTAPQNEHRKVADGPELSVVKNARIVVHWNNADEAEVLDINATPVATGLASYEPQVSSLDLDDRASIDTIYIVTPSYNSEEFIDRTIQSVALQEGDFFIRYHVQDGGSKDSTVEKIEAWAQELANPDSKLINCRGVEFTYESGPDDGMYDAISKGISAMDVPENGILSWINSDDTFMPGAFATVYDVMRNNHDAFWILNSMCRVLPMVKRLSSARSNIRKK